LKLFLKASILDCYRYQGVLLSIDNNIESALRFGEDEQRSSKKNIKYDSQEQLQAHLESEYL